MVNSKIDEVIFSRYGKALYHAQNLEYALKRVIILYSKKDSKLTGAEFKRFLEGRIVIESKTPALGSLIAELQKIEKLRIIDGLVKLLYQAMGDRNFLFHEFFWDRYRSETDISLYKIHNEFDHYDRLFQDIETWLNRLIVQWGEQTINDNRSFLGKLRELGFSDDLFNKDFIWSVAHAVTVYTDIQNVWRVFVDRNLTQQIGGWYESDWNKGSDVRFKLLDGTIHAYGEIHEVNHPYQLHYTWFYNDSDKYSLEKIYSKTRFELTPIDNATLLAVEEVFTQPVTADRFSILQSGWQMYLSKIKHVAEMYTQKQKPFTWFLKKWWK